MKNKFDIHQYLNKRPLSYSAMSSFSYDPAQWYSNYILGEKQSSPQLTFGSMIDKKYQDDPTFLPHVIRYPILQHKMEAKLGKIPLIGFADAFDPDIPALRDLKTGKEPGWTQEKLDNPGIDGPLWGSGGQWTFYTLLLYLTRKIKPEDLQLYVDWLPTQIGGDFSISLINDKDVHTFKTRRTMRQVLEFGVRIQTTVKAMELYANSRS